MIKDIKLVCFDMDGTIIKQNSWYKLNLALGISDEEDQSLYEAYHEKKITYEEWTDTLLRLYKERGLATRKYIEETLADFTLADNAKETRILRSIKYFNRPGGMCRRWS